MRTPHWLPGNRSPTLHILFVCSQGIYRSPTAAALFRDETVEGVRLKTDYAGRSIEPEDEAANSEKWHAVTKKRVEWADLILAMEEYHARAIRSKFPEHAGKVATLNIEDRYAYYDLRLIRLLRAKVPAAIRNRPNLP